jgi:type IV secretion system protein TrbL
MANAGGIAAAAEGGQRAALLAGSSRSAVAGASSDAAAPNGAPEWARRLRAEQSARHHRHSAIQAIRESDGGGAAANPDIREKED